MTPTQQKLISRIKANIVKEAHGEEFAYDYEIKKWDVEKGWKGTYSIVMETGRINDEKTAGAVFCRSRKHIFIGKRGSIKFYNSSKQRFDSTGLWRVFCPSDLGC